MKIINYINKITIFLYFLALLVLTGCESLSLDEKPEHFIGPDNYYTTPAQVETILASCQRNCFRSWGSRYDHAYIFHNLSDQDRGGSLIVPQNHAAPFFATHFENIKDLNHAIKAINDGKVETNETIIVELMGQLKFLRGWNYFQLVRMWGPVPLLTEETEDYFTYLPSRAPIEDIYSLIISDFEYAIESLPVSWGSRVGRPTKDAAKGLLAKVYLTMATAPLNDISLYAKAAKLSREVIDSGNYSLVKDIREVFSMETKYGPEMMWSFNANDLNPATHPKIWSGIYGWGDHSVDLVWAESFPEQPRKHAYLETYNRNGVPWEETGKWSMGMKKFLYDSIEDFNRGFSKINIPIIRYAEVLLIFAEAENMSKGAPTQEAVDAINLVIERANDYVDNPDYPNLTINMSKEEFDQAVIRERNFELCFEFDRWFDIIRKDLMPEVAREEIRHDWSDHFYLWPIPEREIRLNPNMIQNPGYNYTE